MAAWPGGLRTTGNGDQRSVRHSPVGRPQARSSAPAALPRGRCDLYHSALELTVPDGRYVIEMTPVRAADGAERDVAASGPVGARWAGRFRIFRYEIRRWRNGFIPDVAHAVDGPRRVIDNVERARGCSSWCHRFQLPSGPHVSLEYRDRSEVGVSPSLGIHLLFATSATIGAGRPAEPATDLVAARCGEHWRSSEMLALEAEQGSAAPCAIERALLDHA
jgi:hypothetical protein